MAWCGLYVAFGAAAAESHAGMWLSTLMLMGSGRASRIFVGDAVAVQLVIGQTCPTAAVIMVTQASEKVSSNRRREQPLIGEEA